MDKRPGRYIIDLNQSLSIAIGYPVLIAGNGRPDAVHYTLDFHFCTPFYVDFGKYLHRVFGYGNGYFFVVYFYHNFHIKFD